MHPEPSVREALATIGVFERDSDNLLKKLNAVSGNRAGFARARAMSSTARRERRARSPSRSSFQVAGPILG